MFNKIKKNKFYNKLINNKNISTNFFDTINNDLKDLIIKDERFADYITFDLIIKESTKDNRIDKTIDEYYIYSLSDDKLKTFFKRLSNYEQIHNIDLTNIFNLLKEKYIANDGEFKNIISDLLYKTVSESFSPQIDYINNFVNLFNKDEKLELLKDENMFKFITFYSKSTEPYYGYKNFLSNIFNNIDNTKMKYVMYIKIFELMPKKNDVKSLFLESVRINLNNDEIVNLFQQENIINEFKFKGDNRTFNYELILDTIVETKDYEQKKELINNYFTGFESIYIYNLIANRNEKNSGDLKVDGQTIKAFYELNILKENVDDLIIKSCKDELLFETLEKYTNKQELLYKISKDVDIELLIDFTKKYNLNIYNEDFAKKFFQNDKYFEFLPHEFLDLLKYYIGNNNEMFFNKLKESENIEELLLNSYAQIDIDKLIIFAKEKNIDLCQNRFLEKYSSKDKIFALLTEKNCDLISIYKGKNIELFFSKLSLSNNKIEILFTNQLSIDEDNVLNKAITSNYFDEKEKNLIKEVIKINDKKIKEVLKSYIKNNYTEIPENRISVISELLNRIEISNSIEILNFRSELANQLLNTDNPIENLTRIENIFIKNNLPTVGKLYSVFEVLHPNFDKFNFDETSKISPVLKSKSKLGKKITIFADLLKASLGSNNRSLKEYIKSLEVGNKIYTLVINNKLNINELDIVNKQILENYANHLITLYNNTLEGKKEPFSISNSLDDNIITLKEAFLDTKDLPNKIVKMFCYFAGFETLDSLKQYMDTKIKLRENKNRNASKEKIILERGDLIKGIGKIEYLQNILQNGSVSKEYLGAYSSSDATPLDTDVSKITNVKETLSDTIKSTSSKDYGPIWLVLKNDGRFKTTRSNEISENNLQYDNQNYELFYTGKTGEDHYGIRTGFASSDIDYIVSEYNDPRINLEIAINGFYIPVYNLQNELIFTITDYENLRSKMAGRYYDINTYNFSPNLITNETLTIANNLQSNYENTSLEQQNILNSIKEAIKPLNLTLKDYSDGDLTEGSVELINTGSTGRGTNLLNDSDHDFIMKLDKNILLDPIKLQKLKETIINSFESIEYKTLTSQGDFRFTGVKVKGIENPIKLDITFMQKTNKINYSTDSAIKDRLNIIKENDHEKYNLVIANILLAKQMLKNAKVYKSKRSNEQQGGLGGVGVENWILNNGGSLVDAAKSFLDASNGKNFAEFKETYYIWDFGENYMSASSERTNYLHDNFVNNMSEEGYDKMKECLKNYLNNTLKEHKEDELESSILL